MRKKSCLNLRRKNLKRRKKLRQEEKAEHSNKRPENNCSPTKIPRLWSPATEIELENNATSSCSATRSKPSSSDLLSYVAQELYSHPLPAVPACTIQPQTFAQATATTCTPHFFDRDNHGSSDFNAVECYAAELAHVHGWRLKKETGKYLRFFMVEFPPEGESIVSRSVTVNADLSWEARIHGNKINAVTNPLFNGVSETINGSNSLLEILCIMAESNICIGNPDRFQELFNTRGPVLTYKNLTVYCEKGYFVYDNVNKISYGTTTARTQDCQYILGPNKNKCTNCLKARNVLRAAHSRVSEDMSFEQKVKRVQHDSRTPLAHLSTNELQKRVQNTQKEKSKLKVKVKKLEESISKQVQKEGVKVDQNLHDGLKKVMIENTKDIESTLEPGTVKHLFWMEQKRQALQLDARGMRWHPLMIKWCLALRQVSPSAYSFVKNSGMISLPSERTLFDFTHWTKAEPGVNLEILEKLMDEIDLEKNKPYVRNVGIVHDEMKIKGNLVYSKQSGEVIGFVNLGDFNNELQKFEKKCNGEDEEPEVATHVLVLMVRGLFSKLAFPFAHFPCQGFRSDQLFTCVWEGVMVLESLGLKVRSSTADGASPNRKFIRVHRAAGLPKDAIVYKTKNIYADEDKDLYFFCDPPHLVKTTRNCWEKSHNGISKRKMRCDKFDISWKHLQYLYERDVGLNRCAPGLRLVPKLKHEHVFLNSFLRMRVNLAAQVLSSSVAKAFEFLGQPHTEGTQKFVLMMDRFFDCMNVKNFTEGLRNNNKFKEPYRDRNDERFQWLSETFLGYLNDWKASISRDYGHLPKEQQNRMSLSRETLEGLHITVKSFVELAPILLDQPGVVSLLSEKFSQDPLEEYFGKQRRCGGSNDNPTYHQFINNDLALIVAGSTAVSSARGNCRGNRNIPAGNRVVTPAQCKPLKRRQHNKEN